MRIVLALLATLALAGCAGITAPPQLGLVENGIYHDAWGRFRCPLPGAEQGFAAPVKIDDAVRMTRQEFDIQQNRNLRIPDGWAVANEIRFVDAADPARRVMIRTAILGAHDLADYRENRKRAGVYETGIQAGNYGLVSRGMTSRLEHHTTLGVMQFPYWDEEQSYMGTGLAEAYRKGETSMGPVEVLGVANFVIELPGENQVRHVYVEMSRAAQPLLPGYVDPRDLSAVLNALRRDANVARTVRGELVDYIASCDWTQQAPPAAKSEQAAPPRRD